MCLRRNSQGEGLSTVDVFSLPVLLPFLRVHFRAVGVARILRVFSPQAPKIAFGIAPLQQRVSKRGAVGGCTKMHVGFGVGRGHVHHHCVLDGVCERFLMRVPNLQHPVPRLSGLIRHLRFAGTMIFRIKAYWRLCVSSSYWLCVRRHASSLLVSYTERTRVRTLLFVIRASGRSVCCMQRDRVLFRFTSVSQLLRDWTDESHVDPETEAEVLVLSIVAIKHRSLAQTSQVFEQLCINKFRREDLHFSNAAPQPCVILKTNSQACDSRLVRSNVRTNT